jgi:hypothetical protein
VLDLRGCVLVAHLRLQEILLGLGQFCLRLEDEEDCFRA